jgi:lipopolysaccharide export system protein LptA
MQRRNRFTCVLVLIMTVFLYETVSAENGIPVKLAVVPFDVYSAASESKLGKDFAVMLSDKLALNPYIYLSEIEDVQSVVKIDKSHFDSEQLKEIAKLLGANFVLFGSVTKIKDYHSIDVQLFNVFPPEEYSKAFVEGVDIEFMVESLALKIEADVLEKAEYIPLSQRINIKSKNDVKVDEDFIFAMENEIGEEKKMLPAEGKPVESNLLPETAADERPALEQTVEQEGIITENVQVNDSNISESEDASKKEVSAPEVKIFKKKIVDSSFKFDSPVNINSDSLEYDNSANRILFNGNVVARQSDILMFADKMDVLYNDEGEIRTIASQGNVKVIQGERIATGDKIIFFKQEQKIIVTGNPRVWQGDNVIQGKKITVFLKEDRSVIEGGPDGRVNATIYPDKAKP